MKYPSEKQLGQGLRKMRNSQGKSAKRIAAEFKMGGRRGFKYQSLLRMETGKGRIPYGRLLEVILPAYGIEDLDMFIDLCKGPKLADVTLFSGTAITDGEISPGVTNTHVAPPLLKSHRTRIDLIRFKPGREKSTPWGNHSGHEFVFVLRGSVKCEFAEKPEGERTEHLLNAGMAIAFPSLLFHRFSNASDKSDAELVAAKPSGARSAVKDGQ